MLTETKLEPGDFTLGSLVATPGALAALAPDEIISALKRHVTCDWGNLDEEDRQANNAAIKDGTRILSSYTSRGGTKFYVITEADRSATTILLPEEY